MLIFIIILSLLHSIMFYNLSLGLNVIVFTIPLISFIVYMLVKNNKVKNKKGLLFIIPIVILSSTYFIYDNSFRYFNYIVIPLLYILMYIYTIKPTYNIQEVCADIVNLLFAPVDSIAPFFSESKKKLLGMSNISDEGKKKLKSILIVAPIAIVVLLLLSNADMMFGSIFKGIFDVFKNINLDNIIGRLVLLFLIFTYLGAAFHYLLNKYKKPEITEINIKIENYTVRLLLTVLNVIYVVFDFIQIRSLLLHHVTEGIDYASYARQGFFELMFISVLNLALILISKHSKEDKYTKRMSILMVVLTLIIIASSFMRMNMYEQAYGYTLLRLLVYVSLIAEVIMLVPTTLYILNSKVNILKYYIIIVTSVYTLINCVSVDYVIAYNNIQRYYNSNMLSEMDTDYLMNYKADNVNLLKELRDKTHDKKMKEDLNNYLNEISGTLKTDNIFEYNVSKAMVSKR